MSPRATLTIPEEVLLLHQALLGPLRRPRPKPVASRVDELIAAGRLIELVLAKRVTVESARRNLLWRPLILVDDPTPTRDALLDDVLERLAGSKMRPCAYWISHVDKGSEIVYWDRLVARSLIRPDDLSDTPAAHVADSDAVAATLERIRAVLAEPEADDLRAVALVSLFAHSRSMGALLHHDVSLSPANLVRSYLAERRDQRQGRQAVDNYKRVVASAPGLGGDQPDWAMAAADSIQLIAQETAPNTWE